MKEYDLIKLVNDEVYLDSKLNEFLSNKIILKQKIAYSTKIKFDKKDVELLKFKSISFVAKINNIIKS